MPIFERAIEAINLGVKRLLPFVLFLMVVVAFLQVIYRYALQLPLVWSEELARYLFVWLTLMGSVIGVAEGTHITVEVMTRLLPRGGQLFLRLIGHLAVLVLLAILTVEGIQLTQATAAQTSSGMGLRMSYVYAAVPLNAFLMGLNVIRWILADLRGLRTWATGERMS
ncbi:MAG: TRAP transporter small permease [candidate division NC10 bacterium]|nr:TRAP transporter small permease [candidate division NC10 bacterium]